MGMWAGIQQGMAAAEASKLAKKQLEMSEEDFELRKQANDRAERALELNEIESKLKRVSTIKNTFGGLPRATTASGARSKKTGPTQTEINQSIQVLSERFQVDEAVIKRVYTQGGADGIVKAAQLAIKYDDKFRTGNYTGDAPSIVVGEMLSGALYTESQTVEYDWDKINETLGVEVDEAVRDMVGDSYVVPGAVTFTEPALVEKIDYAGLEQVEKRGISAAESLARSESRAVQSRLNALIKKSESEALTSTEQTEQIWLTQRIEQISAAQDAFKEDVFTPLIELYGSSYMDTLREYDPSLKGAPLNPVFTEAAQTETAVPNRSVALNLLKAGVLKPGMRVRNLETGKIIPLGE